MLNVACPFLPNGWTTDTVVGLTTDTVVGLTTDIYCSWYNNGYCSWYNSGYCSWYNNGYCSWYNNGYCSWYNNGYCSWYDRLFIWRVPMTLIVSGSHNLISTKLEGKQEMIFMWFPPKTEENGPCFFLIGKQNMRGGKTGCPPPPPKKKKQKVKSCILRVIGTSKSYSVWMFACWNQALVKVWMAFAYFRIRKWSCSENTNVFWVSSDLNKTSSCHNGSLNGCHGGVSHEELLASAWSPVWKVGVPLREFESCQKL